LDAVVPRDPGFAVRTPAVASLWTRVPWTLRIRDRLPIAASRHVPCRPAADPSGSPGTGLMKRSSSLRELATIVNTKVLDAYDAIITANGLAPAPRFDEFPYRRAETPA
jgi:hypothetical protein